jgi:cystathionine gamma-synthase
MLAEHPAVAEVLYPGLPTHPGHKTAQEQMRAFGGMVSFRLLAGEEAAVRVCGRTRLFTLGESLGGVESLIEHPARMTHASAAGSALEVPGDLIRLSVGIEDCDDLIDDLRQALSIRASASRGPGHSGPVRPGSLAGDPSARGPLLQDAGANQRVAESAPPCG